MRDLDEHLESQLRKETVMGKFRPQHGRGFSHKDMHKAAEEMRMEHKGSYDPMYKDSKKNK